VAATISSPGVSLGSGRGPMITVALTVAILVLVVAALLLLLN
jgi:hypothetical protein